MGYSENLEAMICLVSPMVKTQELSFPYCEKTNFNAENIDY